MFKLNFFMCRGALRRLDDYLDRELSPEEQHGVERHLKICRQCARKFAFEASLLREVKAKLQRIDAPASLLDKVGAALDKTSSRE